eukprot:ANDGO_02639.mRNA.1 Putative pseudouridine synthase C1A4.09
MSPLKRAGSPLVGEEPLAKDIKTMSSVPGLSSSQSSAHVACGISGFVNPSLPKLIGTLKERYSDFIVHEISLSGKVCKLESLEIKKEVAGLASSVDKIVSVDDLLNPLGSELLVSAMRELSLMFGEAGSELVFKKLEDRGREYLKFSYNEPLDLPPMENREARKAVHELVRDKLPLFMSITNSADSRIIMLHNRFSVRKEGSSRDVQYRVFSRVPYEKIQEAKLESAVTLKEGGTLVSIYDGLKDRWPRTLPCHLHFTLHKYNIDSLGALSTIAKACNMKPHQFQIAGTKDKRAITSQRISLFHVSAEKIFNAGLLVRDKGIVVGDFEYDTGPQKLGGLKGNVFTLVFRNFANTKDEVEQCVQSLRSDGFLNFFGLQRFGTTAIRTHHIGIEMLKGDWKQAVDLLLIPRPGEKRQPAGRQIWADTRDASAALSKLPYAMGIERMVLSHLAKFPQDYLGSIMKLPRNSRLLYIHAFQSFVFNSMLSLRVEKYGMKPVAGDIVYDRTAQDRQRAMNDHQELSKRAQKRLAKGIAPRQDVDQTLDFMVRHIDEAELHKFAIHDVLLPLPGHSILYPKNEMENAYKAMLREHGISEVDFKGKLREMTISGHYRPMVVKPTNVEYRMFEYDASKSLDQLVLSDLDVIEGKVLDLGSGVKGLALEFGLPSSSYATMCMREVVSEDVLVEKPALTDSGSGRGAVIGDGQVGEEAEVAQVEDDDAFAENDEILEAAALEESENMQSMEEQEDS